MCKYIEQLPRLYDKALALLNTQVDSLGTGSNPPAPFILCAFYNDVALQWNENFKLNAFLINVSGIL